MSSAGPALARPTPKARRTRERILEGSLALFQEKGFDRTSMRDIAAAASLSLGATYYHFRSKDDLVFAFYARTQERAEADARETLRTTTSFAERLRAVVALRLEPIAGYRDFLSVLARNALDPTRPLSPFAPETRETREAAIDLMRQVLEGSDLRVHAELRPRLPALLWLLQLAVLFLWVHDSSPGQARTQRVIDLALGLLTTLLPLTAAPIPGLGRVVLLLGQLIDEVVRIGEGTRALPNNEG